MQGLVQKIEITTILLKLENYGTWIMGFRVKPTDLSKLFLFKSLPFIKSMMQSIWVMFLKDFIINMLYNNTIMTSSTFRNIVIILEWRLQCETFILHLSFEMSTNFFSKNWISTVHSQQVLNKLTLQPLLLAIITLKSNRLQALYAHPTDYGIYVNAE